MKRILFLLLWGSAVAAHAQGSAFTYQGRLANNGSPVNGHYDFQFTPFSAASGGSPVEETVTSSSVGVTNGLFTVLLDFGTNGNVFSGQDRWLDIAVRPAGSGNFTSLNPRQPITPTPYAINARTAQTALNVSGVSGNALHAADANPQNAVFVDNGGNVGIGTVTPASKMHVASGPNDNSPPRLQSPGANKFTAGWDFYHGGTGKGYVGAPDLGAPFAPGEMLLYGGPGTTTTLWSGGARSLTADTAGNVGVGTTTPAAKLEVRGDIRLGPSGQLRAASGEENLRIVRGMVAADGTILEGSGFQVNRFGAGSYSITFDTPFAGRPVVTAMSDWASYDDDDSTTVMASGLPNTGSVNLRAQFPGGTGRDLRFHFIAIGPR